MKGLGVLAACLASAVAGAAAGGFVAVWTMSDISWTLLVRESEMDLHAFGAMAEDLAAGRTEEVRSNLDTLTDAALVRVDAGRRDGVAPMPHTEAALARIRDQREARGHAARDCDVAGAAVAPAGDRR